MIISILFLWAVLVVIGFSGSTVRDTGYRGGNGYVFGLGQAIIHHSCFAALLCSISLDCLISLNVWLHCFEQTGMVLWLLLDNFRIVLRALNNPVCAQNMLKNQFQYNLCRCWYVLLSSTQSFLVHCPYFNLLWPVFAWRMSLRFRLLSVPALIRFL